MRKIFWVSVAFATLLPAVSRAVGIQSIRNGEGQERVYTLSSQDADLRVILQALADELDLNLIIDEKVRGTVSLSLRNVPLQAILDALAGSYNLQTIVEGNIMRVMPQGADVPPFLTTEVIPLDFADSGKLVDQVTPLLSPTGRADVSERTNHLIVTDTPDNLARIRMIVAQLDIRVPQVEIEARLVELSTSFSRNLGIRWGAHVRTGGDVISGVGLAATAPGLANAASQTGATGGVGAGFLPSTPGLGSYIVDLPGGGRQGIGFTLGQVSSFATLNAQILVAESKGMAKIISHPKITTLNKMPAMITSGETIRIRTGGGTVAQGAVSPITLTEIDSGISLNVTPLISPGGYVELTITATRSTLSGKIIDNVPGQSSKTATTNVLVRNGETTVLGGLYETIDTESSERIPFLADIPIIGWLFKNLAKSHDQTELLIFITPRIIA